MMEKYGADVQRYEVVKNGEVIASSLSLAEANELQKLNSGSIVRPE